MDATDYKTQAEASSPVSTNRPTSNIYMSGKKFISKKIFKDSYVDESLFGEKPVEADFEAPWAGEIMFDLEAVHYF